MHNLEYVSIIIPCRNEQHFISSCLDSIIANDYPQDLIEILVVDGMSEDETVAVVKTYIDKYPFISLLENQKSVTPIALNIGIKKAKGTIIIRMDAHARLDCRYISQCVRALNEYEADNVGGNMVTLPQTPSFLGNAIVLSLSHRFGVGNSYFRAHPREPKWVDTVFGGCYRRSVFDSVGYFNEALVRGQDMEFNLRLKKAGGRTLLIPDIVSYYYARSTLWEFCKHNWNNGVWAIIPFLYSDIIPVSVRHLIPLGFAIGLMGSLILSLFWQLGLCLLGGLLGSYLLMGMLASIQIAFREHTPKYLFLMPWIFFCLHINYGIGSLWGCARVLVGSLLTSSTKPGGAQI